ncbi:unnamed protein product [Victoria cruziana]
MATSVSSVYLHVVDSVVSKLREEFLNEGVDDGVLSELQALWELKMMQCGAIQGSLERNNTPRSAGPITPVHDLNVPYEGTEEYETPTAEMLFPPTPLQTPVQTPLPVDPVAYQYFPAGPSDFVPIPDTGAGSNTEVKGGRPASYMQPPSPWMNQRPLGVDVNIAYEEGREEEGGTTTQAPSTKDFFTMTSGKRKRDDYAAAHFVPGGYIPQQDGSADFRPSGPENVLTRDLPLKEKSCNNDPDKLRLEDRMHADATIASLVKAKQAFPSIPQNDGLHDIYEEDVANEDYNAPYYDPLSPQNVATPKPAKTEVAEDEEPPLNEDDDDDEDLDDFDQGDEEPSINHLVLAQFEKVNRTKSRWKCILKDGIMRLNNKDILFTKANGEFDF